MITAYFFGSSIRIPPIFTNSASTPSTFMELIFSTSAGGNVFSIPKRIPIFFATVISFFVRLKQCHPERSEPCAKRKTHAVEGPLHLQVFSPGRPRSSNDPRLKILRRHPLPERPIMLAVISKDIQPVRDLL